MKRLTNEQIQRSRGGTTSQTTAIQTASDDKNATGVEQIFENLPDPVLALLGLVSDSEPDTPS